MKYLVFGKDGKLWSGGPYSEPVRGHINVTLEQAMKSPEMEDVLKRVVFEAANGQITSTTLEQCRELVKSP
jgi:hypothetical protein